MAIASASPGMGAEISDLGLDLTTANPKPNAGLKIVGRVNDLAYGNVDSRLERTLTTLQEGTLRGYRADLNGAPAAVALALHHGEDCGVSFVATVPQAQAARPRHPGHAQRARGRHQPRPDDDHAPGHGAGRTPVPAARAETPEPDGAVGKKTVSSTLCRRDGHGTAQDTTSALGAA